MTISGLVGLVNAFDEKKSNANVHFFGSMSTARTENFRK